MGTEINFPYLIIQIATLASLIYYLDGSVLLKTEDGKTSPLCGIISHRIKSFTLKGPFGPGSQCHDNTLFSVLMTLDLSWLLVTLFISW